MLNFDTEFTKEEPTLTPINVEVVRTINQDEFKGFSFYNTQFGKQVGERLKASSIDLGYILNKIQMCSPMVTIPIVTFWLW